MEKTPYEISLWTQRDEYIETLLSSEDESKKPPMGKGMQGFSPIFTRSTTNENTLRFAIPIAYIDVVTNTKINNQLFYDSLHDRGLLNNEQRVKLIFNKMKPDQTIFEFVIDQVREVRSGQQLICEILCTGLAFKELGTIGYDLVLDIDTVILEEKEKDITINPTINYWLDKVFPKTEDGNWATNWQYLIQMNLNDFLGTGRQVDKVYEENNVESWSDTVDSSGNITSSAPQYGDNLREKVRFCEIADSTKYNITQTLAELFNIFARYEFLYEDADNPFKITTRQVVFYNETVEDTEYAITYGNNEIGLSKESNSADIATKMYITPVESEFSDTGLITIADAPNNYLQDDFLLNFDYFIQSGQLSDRQIGAIPKFQENIRNINQKLTRNRNSAITLQNEIFSNETQISILKDKVTATQELVDDYLEKITTFDAALSVSILQDKNIAYFVQSRNGQIIVDLKRGGAIANSNFLIEKTNHQIVSENDYYFLPDAYGYVAHVVFTGEVNAGDIVSLSYDYDLLSYYRNEATTQISAIAALENSISEKEKVLGDKESDTIDIQGTLYDQQRYLDNEFIELKKEKIEFIQGFNNTMGYFLKEGRWTPSDYNASVHHKEVQGIIYYDTQPLSGETLAYYIE